MLPNAGLPVIVDGKAHYPLTPARFRPVADALRQRLRRQHRRRLLRHHARRTCRRCAECDRQSAIRHRKPQRQSTWRPQVSSHLLRRGHPPGNQLPDRRRADQHQRLEEVQQAAGGRRLGRHGRDGQGRGARWLARAGCLRRFRRPRRREGHARGGLALRAAGRRAAHDRLAPTRR